MSQIKVKELSYQYGDLNVLQNLSFNISSGEVVGLLGVNGAGKSTLFKILSGLYFLQKGQIFFDDLLVGEYGKNILGSMRSKMGVVFQDCSLDNKLTAVSNLKLSARLYGANHDLVIRKIDEGLQEFKLDAVKKQKVKTFSGGMKRRLELLRALLHEPEFLLMDEPSSGLDYEGFHVFWKMIFRERKKRPLITMVATHKIEEAEKCDRLLILHKGQLLASRTPSELKSLVKGDRICLKFSSHITKQEKLDWLNLMNQQFSSLDIQHAGDEVTFVSDDGHRLVPRIIEILPKASVESIFVRQPTLADAFLHITGEKL